MYHYVDKSPKRVSPNLYVRILLLNQRLDVLQQKSTTKY